MAKYHELLKGKVYIGGVDDIPEVVAEQNISDVYDLRDNGKEPEGFPKEATRHHYPIVEDEVGQEASVQGAIQAVKDAVNNNKKIYFHCSGGRNRTGTVAVGLLIELGLASSVQEAEATAKAIRPDISIKPDMRDALKGIYKSN